MDLIWFNCFTYNRVGTPVHSLGLRGESRWVREWGQSPFAGLAVHMRARPAAQAPAPLYAPAAAPKKSRGAGGVPRGGRAAPPARPRAVPGAPRAAGGGVARTKSVNSYRAYQALPPDKQAQLAEALQDEGIMAAKQDGVVAILQAANELPTNEDGEVELDLSAVTPATCWRLYEFVFGPVAAAAGPPPMAPARSSGFRLEEDSDYEPEEDDDD